MAAGRSRWARALGSAAALGSLVALPAAGAGLDAALYGRILEEHTVSVADPAGVRVDYEALGESEPWRRLIRSLASIEPDLLADRDQRLAFWINAYNILAIDLVVRHQPVESIRDIGSFLRPVWGREAGTIGGRGYSLGEIEHEILRPLGEPRIHAAIVCASVSCPSLRREPYLGSRLDAQLDDALGRWLANPHKGARLDREAGVLLLSRVFKWFDEDFEAGGGVLAVLAPHLPDEIQRWLRARSDPPRIRYFDYDWRLNGVRAAPDRRR